MDVGYYGVILFIMVIVPTIIWHSYSRRIPQVGDIYTTNYLKWKSEYREFKVYEVSIDGITVRIGHVEIEYVTCEVTSGYLQHHCKFIGKVFDKPYDQG